MQDHSESPFPPYVITYPVFVITVCALITSLIGGQTWAHGYNFYLITPLFCFFFGYLPDRIVKLCDHLLNIRHALNETELQKRARLATSGSVLNLLGSAALAFSIKIIPTSQFGSRMELGGKEVALPILVPTLFYGGLILIALGFLLNFMANITSDK
jgi:hypothetical protein